MDDRMNKQFGAPLSMPQRQPQQGVLPTPGAAYNASASNDMSNRVRFAEGGEVQDTGDALPTAVDPFNVLTDALNYGRKKFGLPPSFYGNAEPRQKTKTTDEEDQGETEATAFAEGGDVSEDTGVLPTSQDQQPDTGAAMAYLRGDDAVDPSIASAMERRVDPAGRLDPSSRKLQAINVAGSPDKAWGLMQHYRQKFNAYTAFARAAAQGTPQRPADISAAARAATQAYENIPGGGRVMFMPVQGGVQVQMQAGPKSRSKQRFAEGGTVEDEDPADNSLVPQQEPLNEASNTQPVMSTPTEPVEPTWENRRRGTETSLRRLGEQVVEKFPVTEADREIAGGAKSVVLSIPQFVKWLSGQFGFDAALDQDTEKTAQQVAASPNMGVGPTQQTMPQVELTGLNSGLVERGNVDLRRRPTLHNPDGSISTIRSMSFTDDDGKEVLIPTITPQGVAMTQDQAIDYYRNTKQHLGKFDSPQSATAYAKRLSEEMGRQQASGPMSPGAPGTYPPRLRVPRPRQFTEPTSPSVPVNATFPPPPQPRLQGPPQRQEQVSNNPTLRDVLQEIENAYGPGVGNAQQKALARAAAIQAWAANQSKQEQERIKGENANTRAQTTATAAMDRLKYATNAKQAADVVRHDDRVMAIRARMETAIRGQDMANYRAAQHELDATVRTLAGNFLTPTQITETINELTPFLPRAGTTPPAGSPAAPPRPANAQPVAQPAATDISYLRAHPDKAAAFDARFGAGAAKRVLGQ